MNKLMKPSRDTSSEAPCRKTLCSLIPVTEQKREKEREIP